MFDIKSLAVILIIVILLFGTKKLKTLGSDLGSAIKGFKKSVADDETDDENEAPNGVIEQKESEASGITKSQKDKAE